jgi:uncharacterized protein YndB with AHSA1/START domain
VAQISHVVRVRAAPDDVYRRITSASGIARWLTRAYCPRFDEGEMLELEFPDGRVRFVIEEMETDRRTAWRCTSEDHRWAGTRIVFDLEPRGELTLLAFDHGGWPEESDFFWECNMSWAYFLESLRSLVEEGRGTPEILRR